MSSEPKNLDDILRNALMSAEMRQGTTDYTPYVEALKKEIASHYSKLAEGGREEIVKELNYCFFEGSESSKPSYHWSQETIITYALNKLLPIIGAMVKKGIDDWIQESVKATETGSKELDAGSYVSFEDLVKERVEAEIKRRGLVKLAEDQNFVKPDDRHNGYPIHIDWNDGQQALFDSGFRRVVQEEGK